MARIRAFPARRATRESPSTQRGEAERSSSASPRRWASLCVLAAAACGLSAPTCGQRADARTRLRDLVGGLVASVATGDEAGVDDVVCLDWLARAQAERRERLGLVADAADAAALDGFRAHYRQAVFARVADLTRRGSQIDGIDLVRVDLGSSDAAGGEHLLAEEGSPESWRIDASGVLGVWLQGRRFDVDVYRVGARWCLNPVSVQP